MKTLTITQDMAYKAESKTIEEEIIIEAQADLIWETLTNIGEWQNWNPFIVKSEGALRVGETIKNTMVMGYKSFVFRPRIIAYEKNKRLSWRGITFIPGIFTGEHHFIIETINNQKVKLTQYEKFSGILAKPMLKKIGEQTAKNFRKMNEALKQKVESRNV